jgi:hypothetical protein
MMRVATDQLPPMHIHYNPGAIAFRPHFGPEAGRREMQPNWNMANWALR